MKILYRIVIVVGFMIPGLLLGMLFAAKTSAAEGSGLAGGAIVLGYGVMGALIAGVIGLVIGIRLSDTALPRAAAVSCAVLVLFAAYVAVRIRSEQQSHLDPPEAYEGIPAYSLTLERTQHADSMLAKTLLINSTTRTWSSLLPDGRRCSAQASAESLRKAAGALEAFLKSTGGLVECSGEAEEVLKWKTESDVVPKEGSISLNAACLASGTKPDAQFLVFALQQVSMTSDAPVSCK